MKDLRFVVQDLLGGEQSGFINEIGFDTYQKNHERSYRRIERE
jgi:transcription-repair coupling factor (superfamily II helicase)